MNTSNDNERSFLKTWVAVWCIASTVTIAAGGCASRGGIFDVDCCADVAAGSVPEPVGTKVCQWQQAQVSSAAGDLFTFYRADFVGDTATLSPGSLSRLSRHSAAGNLGSQALILEPSGNTELDSLRVSQLSDAIATLGIESPSIEIATPPALGLAAPFAERVAGGSVNNQNSSRNIGAPTTTGNGNRTNAFPGGIF